jgi:hypothetical protein
LAGGGDLSANRTLSLNTGSGLTTSGSNLIVDSSVVPLLASANVFTNVQQITIPSAATKGLIVRAAASQSANQQEWQGSDGTLFSFVSAGGSFYSSGRIQAGTTSPVTAARMYSVAGSATDIPLMVRGAASQTADLQQWQNSAGTVLGGVNSTGIIYAPRFSFGSAGGVSITTASGRIYSNALWTIENPSASASENSFRIRGAASQTGNLQEWQNSGATVLAKVDATGNIVVGNMAIATSSVATIHISNGTIPSANPTGGGVLYVEAGALKYRGSSGTITTIANA